MSKPAIAKVWTFASSSGRGNYETLMFVDMTTSCGCPGWTRRTTTTGARSCKHTRLVDMGRADEESTSHHDYRPDLQFQAGAWQGSPAASAAVTAAPPAFPSLRKDAPGFGMRTRKLS
jgi:hypothetical protein